MIAVLGISHQTADVRLRERFAFSTEQARATALRLKLLRLKHGGNTPVETATVILSTCNRAEVYCTLDASCARSVRAWLLREVFGVDSRANGAATNEVAKEENVQEHFYFHTDEAAVRHLFRVSAGLDSAVLGEDQIIQQLKAAYRLSLDAQASSATMNKLFHKAFEVSKRVRTETQIARGATSVSHIAANLVEQALPAHALRTANVLILGAGETGALVAEHFARKQAQSVRVVNRTFAKACTVAERHGYTAISFDNVGGALHQADAIVIAVEHHEPLADYALLLSDERTTSELDRPRVVVDVSVPAQIRKQALASLPNVQAFDIDDVHSCSAATLLARSEAVEAAQNLIEQGIEEFSAWQQGASKAAWLKSINEHLRGIHAHHTDTLRFSTDAERLAELQHYGNELINRLCRYLAADASAQEFLKHRITTGVRHERLQERQAKEARTQEFEPFLESTNEPLWHAN
jgi:glutamyl-tRNA reductase